MHEAPQLLQRRGRALFELHRCLRGRVFGAERCGARAQHETEESLRGRVVQLAGDAVALLNHGELLRALVEIGVRNRDARIRGECFEAPRVSLREVPVAMPAHEEVADARVPRWVIGTPRKSVSVGWCAG